MPITCNASSQLTRLDETSPSCGRTASRMLSLSPFNLKKKMKYAGFWNLTGIIISSDEPNRVNCHPPVPILNRIWAETVWTEHTRLHLRNWECRSHDIYQNTLPEQLQSLIVDLCDDGSMWSEGANGIVISRQQSPHFQLWFVTLIVDIYYFSSKFESDSVDLLNYCTISILLV